MSSIKVSLVSAHRTVWSGEAKQLVARTTEGELGVLPGHTPLLAVLAEGQVTIYGTDGQNFRAEVDGGFLSISEGAVLVVAENVEAGAGSGN